MFKFLKEKLKSAISKISNSVEKEGEIEERVIEKPVEIKKVEEKGFFAKLREKFVGKEKKEIIEEKKPIIEEQEVEIKEKAFDKGNDCHLINENIYRFIER
jgi:hypothetical protein